MSPEATHVCSEGIAPVRAAPDPQSELLTELLLGEEFVAQSEHEGLVFGATAADGIEGFVPAAFLLPRAGGATHRVRRTFIEIYRAPALTMASGKILPMNALVEVGGRTAPVRYPGGGPGSTAVELRSGGWVTEQGLSPAGHFATDVQAVARMFIGAVYLHGGKTWLGCDGAGFVQTVLAACGMQVPRRLEQQIRYFEGRGPASDAQAHRHAVIYSGTSCGLLFGNDVVAARPQTMLVDVSSRRKFLMDSPNQPRVFALDGV
jgi:cell wall-associated NlpC family hydrolase